MDSLKCLNRDWIFQQTFKLSLTSLNSSEIF